MKIKYAILGVAAGTALFLASGCSKEEPPAGESPKAMNPAPSETQKAAEAPTAPTEPAQPAAAAPAAQAVEAATTQAMATAPAAAVSQPAAPALSDAQKAVQAPPAAPEPAQPAPATPAAQAVQTAAAQGVASAAAAAATTNTQVQALIDKAKGLVTDQKYQEALNVVQQLSNVQLTPEQQKLVDGLKAQIQAALAKTTATGAASALGNVLGGQK